MPIYAFDCGACGPCEVVRPMAQAGAPAACPTCSGEARRRFTPPGLALVERPLRRALDREEKSAHEPDVVSRKEGRAMPHLHTHGHAPPWAMTH
jgi:putative FmdB family regulatory protein